MFNKFDRVLGFLLNRSNRDVENLHKSYRPEMTACSVRAI